MWQLAVRHGAPAPWRLPRRSSGAWPVARGMACRSNRFRAQRSWSASRPARRPP